MICPLAESHPLHLGLDECLGTLAQSLLGTGDEAGIESISELVEGVADPARPNGGPEVPDDGHRIAPVGRRFLDHRTILGHLDRTIDDPGSLKKLAAAGCILEFDLFGNEGSYSIVTLPVDMPNDNERLRRLQWLIAEGHGESILISHDIAFKQQWVCYGGHGYAHILANVVPLMRRKGFREEDISAILVDTPRRILAFQ